MASRRPAPYPSRPVPTQAFPSALYTINLGLHTVAPEFRKPRYLLEVLPTLLSGRSFKPPSTLQQLELGYREAPSAHEPMTMVFAKVRGSASTRAGPGICVVVLVR